MLFSHWKGSCGVTPQGRFGLAGQYSTFHPLSSSCKRTLSGTARRSVRHYILYLVPGPSQHVCLMVSWLIGPLGLVRYQLRSSIDRYKSLLSVCQVGLFGFLWGEGLSPSIKINGYRGHLVQWVRHNAHHFFSNNCSFAPPLMVARWSLDGIQRARHIVNK